LGFLPWAMSCYSDSKSPSGLRLISREKYADPPTGSQRRRITRMPPPLVHFDDWTDRATASNITTTNSTQAISCTHCNNYPVILHFEFQAQKHSFVCSVQLRPSAEIHNCSFSLLSFHLLSTIEPWRRSRRCPSGAGSSRRYLPFASFFSFHELLGVDWCSEFMHCRKESHLSSFSVCQQSIFSVTRSCALVCIENYWNSLGDQMIMKSLLMTHWV